MMKRFLMVLISVALSFSGYAQKEKLKTSKGNEAYQAGQYDAAVQEYEKALESKDDYKEAIFNKGNALQRKSRDMMEQAMALENPQEKQGLMQAASELSLKAAAEFEKIAAEAETPEEKNKTNYNLGNSRLLGGEIDQSIEAYKDALRANPADDDARYNLAYAQRLKQKQEEEKQDDEQEQDQEQNEDQEQDKEQEQDQNQDENKEQDKDQPQPDQLSKEEAEQMLDAMMNQEKDLQEELNKKKHKAQRIRIEKDW